MQTVPTPQASGRVSSFGFTALLASLLVGLTPSVTLAQGPCQTGFFSRCCFDQQPLSHTVCEDTHSNAQYSFTAVFQGGLRDEFITQWTWERRLNGGPWTVIPNSYGTGWTAYYPIQGFTPGAVGEYRCQFWEEPNGNPGEDGTSCAIVYSDICSYNVMYKVRIVGVPAPDQTVCPGGNASFHVEATNAGVYQWLSLGSNEVSDGITPNGTVISGANTPTLVFSNVSPLDTQLATLYQCRVSGGRGVTCGTQYSIGSHLIIKQGPPVGNSPRFAETTICNGGNTSFTVNATGQDVAIQWYKHYSFFNVTIPLSDGNPLNDNTVFSGTQTSTLTISNARTSAAGDYYCTLTNACGTLTYYYTRRVNITQPVSVDSSGMTNGPVVCATLPNGSVYFYVNASAANLSTRWYKRNAAGTVSQITNGGRFAITSIPYQLQISSPTVSDTGDYWCSLSSDPAFPACGTVDSTPQTLTVVTGSPTATSTPVNVQTCLGSSAQFAVSVASAPGITYRWFAQPTGGSSTELSNGTLASGTVIAGANTPSLQLSNIHASDLGGYQCYTSSPCAGFYIFAGILSTFDTPAITLQPQASAPTCVGSSAVLSVAATGENLTYQWTRNNVDLAVNSVYTNVNTPTLNILINAGFNTANFRCRVTSNGCNSVVSSASSVSRINPIAITVQPASITICGGGGTAFFQTAFSGSAPYTMQWRRNGIPLTDGPGISGATTSELTLTSVDTADTGLYSCYVSNTCGTAVSNPATLAVAAPVFVQQPIAAATCSGGSTTITIATDPPATSYIWQRRAGTSGAFTTLTDGNGISGSTTPTLSLAAVDATTPAYYRCRAMT